MITRPISPRVEEEPREAIYEGVKHLCDLYLTVPTVCMRASNVKDPGGRLQKFANVALKFNTKLGGVNHKLEENSTAFKLLTKEPTMLVGMDVTHPSPGSMKGTPSICAVVASMDDRFVHFPAGLSIQRNKNIDKDSEEVSPQFCHAFTF